MKRFLLPVLLSMAAVPAIAGTFTIQGTEYTYDELTRKEIGPGVIYHRLRVPDYPLNINYLEVDLTNPYNNIENQQPYDAAQGIEVTGRTEKLADAYTRQKEAGRKPLGGANANFWVVSGQGRWSEYCLGTTYQGNLKNGKIIHETNMTKYTPDHDPISNETTSDLWWFGPQLTGVVGIDANKKVYVESMGWKGYVSSPRWGADVKKDFANANKYCRSHTSFCCTGQMVMYNSYYGKNKKFQTVDFPESNLTYNLVDGITCEVYVNIDETSGWATNKDIVGTVMEVKDGQPAGTLGEYDYCLAGTGAYRDDLKKLQPGDKITMNYGWYGMYTDHTPQLVNAVAGVAIVLKDGEHPIVPNWYPYTDSTPRKDPNDYCSYNTQTYSRCAYATSKDGKTFYQVVMDMSTDPVYGKSAGCNTTIMCEIMKQLGAWDICNMDAGGSAQLMVEGEVVNKTTESTPRAVANGWFVYSVAPDDDKSNVITRLEMLDYNLSLPIYSTYVPTILAYNEYGELINDNLEGFTLECDPAYGTTADNKFNVGGTKGETALTIKYNGITRTVKVNIVDSPVAIRLPNIYIDAREYPIEVYTGSEFNKYPCDPARLTWTVSDEAVASVTNGVLKGLSNGTCTITGTIGDFSTFATVNVQIPTTTAEPVYTEFPTDAKLTQVGGTGIALSQEGDAATLTYTGNGTSRGAYIAVNKSTQIFGLPYAIRVKINPGDAEIKKVSFTAKNALEGNYASHTMSEETLPKNTESVLELPLSDWCNPNDIGIYPIEFTELRFGMGASAKGTQFTIKYELEALYESNGGITAATIATSNVKLYPNPVSTGVATLRLADTIQAQIAVYNAAGAKVLDRAADFSGGSYTMNVADLAPGLYFVRIESDGKIEVARMIIK